MRQKLRRDKRPRALFHQFCLRRTRKSGEFRALSHLVATRAPRARRHEMRLSPRRSGRSDPRGRLCTHKRRFRRRSRRDRSRKSRRSHRLSGDHGQIGADRHRGRGRGALQHGRKCLSLRGFRAPQRQRGRLTQNDRRLPRRHRQARGTHRREEDPQYAHPLFKDTVRRERGDQAPDF